MRRYQECAARLENPVECVDRRSEAVNKLQSLSEDDAIEAVRRDMVRLGKVPDDRGVWVTTRIMEYIGVHDTIAPKSYRIVVIGDFENAATYISREFTQKFFNVITVENLTPIPTVLPIDGVESSK